MTTRTLHCSDRFDNYNLVLQKKIAGFSHRGQSSGDLVYLIYKKDRTSFCGARFTLDAETDENPWGDAEKYKVCWSIRDIEYCEHFDVHDILLSCSEYWTLKYLQGSKSFDEKAARLLDAEFRKRKTKNPVAPQVSDETPADEDEIDESNLFSEEDEQKIERSVPETKIEIMGTFQTINFENETNPFRGLERLVTDNFFELFPRYNRENSILIAKNRLFKTHKMDEKFSGVSRLPDALLITFNKNRESPLALNLIEYECYGERKTSPAEKSKYMSGHIIPQLMQFASAFSIITDQKTRAATVDEWTERIVDEISAENLWEKVKVWILTKNPKTKDIFIASEFQKLLRAAFKKALRVFLVIDDLSGEQRETVKNIISSFKLESGADVGFDSSIVKLVQKINVIDANYEYGLTAQ